MALKWGILSAGRISHDFVTALATIHAGEHEVVSVAARNLAKAQEFAKLHKIPTAHEGYEALANDANVEIVYIGSLHPDHLAHATLLLENGKHVLCEKPLTMNEKDSKKLFALAKEKKRFLMEGIWSRFYPSYQYLKKQIDDGVLGEIQQIDVEFGFDLKHNARSL